MYEYSNEKRRESSVKVYRFERNYGAHDWIGEYALRIIQNSEYRGHISDWLYDDYLDIPFKDFDDLQMSGRNVWWDPSKRSDVFNDDTKYLFARRFYRFLYGTLFPDLKLDCLDIFSDIELDSELFYLKEDWMGMDTFLGSQTIFFTREDPSLPSNYYSNKYIPSRYLGDTTGIGAELCQLAALSALYCLNVQQHFTYDDNGEEKTSFWKGKYEAAAICIGAMTHYIADVSIPHHTVQDSPRGLHTVWENYAQYELLMKFDKEIGNGVPCKDIMDPNDLISSENLEVKPMLPYQAAIAMAEKTFMACDEGSNKDIYAYDASSGSEPYLCSPALIDFDLKEISHPYHSEIVERAKKLCCYAVYYTACAILWICELAKMNERTKVQTTSERLIKPKSTSDIKDPIAVSVEQIRDWGRLNFKFPEAKIPLSAAWAQSFSMALFIFVPIVALTTVLILQEVIENPLKKK